MRCMERGAAKLSVNETFTRSISKSEWRRKFAPRVGSETSATMKVRVNLWSIPKSRERILVL